MAQDVSVEVKKNNTKQVVTSINKGIATALMVMGMQAESAAKKICPVDTGRLRNSITYVLDVPKKEVYIGTNVEYAKHVEFGTHKQRAQPFLRPAALAVAKKYATIFKSVFNK